MNLKKIRQKNNMTRKELALLISVSQNTIQYWENNKREPNIKRLKELSLIFNCSVDDLLYDNQEYY